MSFFDKAINLIKGNPQPKKDEAPKVEKKELKIIAEDDQRVLELNSYAYMLRMDDFSGGTEEDLVVFENDIKERNEVITQKVKEVDRTFNPEEGVYQFRLFPGIDRYIELKSWTQEKKQKMEEKIKNNLGDKEQEFWRDGTIKEVEERMFLATIAVDIFGKEAVVDGSTEKVKQDLINKGLREYNLSQLLDLSGNDYLETDLKSTKKKREELRNIETGKFPEVDWYRQETDKYLVLEKELIEKGEKLGIHLGRNETLNEFKKRINIYEKVGDSLETIRNDVEERVKALIEKLDEKKKEHEEKEIDYKVIEEYGTHSGKVYRSTGKLRDGEYQVASFFRRTEYKKDLDKLRVAADILRVQIFENERIDRGRLLFSLKAAGGDSNPFFSFSSTREGAELHLTDGDELITAEIPNGGWGWDIDSIRTDGEYINEDEVAVVGYLDPEWVIKKNGVEEKKIPAAFDCQLETREMNDYLSKTTEEEVSLMLSLKEKDMNRQSKGFDTDDWKNKYENEISRRNLAVDQGLNVRKRMIELLDNPGGITVSEEYNSEKIKNLLEGEHKEIIARAIALYEFKKSMVLFDILKSF